MSLNGWDKSKKIVLDASEKVIRGTAISIFSNIIKQSPVGNPSLWKRKAPPGYTGGRFRGNWQTTLAAPAQGEISGVRGEGQAIGEAESKTRSYKLGQTLFMANNLPYAYKLARGGSKQRPDGWIERIILGFQKTLDREAKKTK